jgi:hypothetical protein
MQFDGYEQSPTPGPPLPPSQHRNVLQTISGRSSINSLSTQSTPLSKSSLGSHFKLSTSLSHPAASQKTKGKRTRQEAFIDENRAETEALANLAADKHVRKMAEHAQRMAELDIKKKRIDLEAKGKHLDAEERRIAAQHQHEREKEQHDMQMLRLRLQYQGASGSGATAEQFSLPEQFADPNAFTDLGMGTDGTYFT